MTLTIKHIYKEVGCYWDCQIDKLEKVISFSTEFDDQGQEWLTVFFEDEQAKSIQLEHNPNDSFDLILCTE